MSDLQAARRTALAGLRYQYARNISSPRFAALVERLLAPAPCVFGTSAPFRQHLIIKNQAGKKGHELIVSFFKNKSFGENVQIAESMSTLWICYNIVNLLFVKGVYSLCKHYYY